MVYDCKYSTISKLTKIKLTQAPSFLFIPLSSPSETYTVFFQIPYCLCLLLRFSWVILSKKCLLSYLSLSGNFNIHSHISYVLLYPDFTQRSLDKVSLKLCTQTNIISALCCKHCQYHQLASKMHFIQQCDLVSIEHSWLMRVNNLETNLNIPADIKFSDEKNDFVWCAFSCFVKQLSGAI